ncbi:FecR domain-containing protein [Patescibacteria group bacterium]|nr:FecR domain-containing protein [Patescibacteria group bacterium]MBU1682405.1 FecR domain-containing protein [Patescibacteria group bacterium]MBU1934626.1 FecR domain-containing protein [Patescibacteria group bacterium]
MDDLKKALAKLPKIDPSKGYLRQSKNRLMNQIQLHQHETWFMAFLKKLGRVMPSEAFVAQARMRLMEQISIVKKPAFAWLYFTKRLVASTMVMLIAVTATLFFVEGGQVVNAYEDTYIEVVSGSVTVKHAYQLIWDEVEGQTELAAGDLIRLEEGAEAVVHFFDDTQLRLAENSSLLISKLTVSPAYSRQGIIEVSLHEGNAWAQTLNVNDGYASFTMVTRDAVIKAINSTFNVQTHLSQPTSVQVFQQEVQLTVLNPETLMDVDSFVIKADEQITINSLSQSAPKVTVITEQNKIEKWVQNNLQKDQDHLTALREEGLNQLRLAAGTLPGDTLYPIKQAKERLKLAFSFGQGDADAQIEIANKRLNEAIVLLEQGDRQNAMEALMAYQSIARQIIENQENAQSVTNQLIIPHQKALIASFPTAAPIGMVKQALNQTEELLVVDPIKREKVKLQNSIEQLQDMASYIEIGDIDAAKEALINHELTVTSILDEVGTIENEEERELLVSEILELRSKELAMLEEITLEVETQYAVDTQFAAMLNSAGAQAEEEMERTVAFITPIMPEVVQEQIADKEPVPKTLAQEFADKVNIYSTWQGQQNQINRLLEEAGANASNPAFLTEIRDGLDGRARDLINTKLLELRSIAKINKDKAVQRKIDRAKRLRDED